MLFNFYNLTNFHECHWDTSGQIINGIKFMSLFCICMSVTFHIMFDDIKKM